MGRGNDTHERLLRGQDGRGGQDYVVAQHVYDEYGPVRMVRTREWKYVHRYAYGPHELYDLRNDPQEHTNRADDPDQGAVRRELKAELDGWFVRYADPQRDGTREAVYGKGQLDLAGPAGRGAQAYAADVTPVEPGISSVSATLGTVRPPLAAG